MAEHLTLWLRSHPRSAHRSAGFTLAELLIVVAIILVLVAVAVPVFTGALTSAEEATCAANRRTLKVLAADTYLFDQTKNLDAIFTDGLATLKSQNNNKDLCPTGGTYSLAGKGSDGIIVIKCSKHGLTMEDELNNWFNENPYKDTDKDSNDTAKRQKYADDQGITSWSEVFGPDGKSAGYLQFKSYGNASDKLFLYVGPEKQITGGGGQWRARYICDTNGLAGGDKGQWYKLPKESDIAIKKDGIEALLKGAGVTPVTFENGKFTESK